MSSVPRPGGVPIHIPKCSTRNVRDIPSVPPEFDGRPDLPSPRSPYFVPGYNVTTHIVPASYPRQSFHDSRQYPHLTPDTTIPPPPERKAERQAWAMGTSSKLVQKPMAILKGRLENHHAEAPAGREESPVMWNVVNRYARVGPHKGEKDIGITVVVNHAIGFHKEIWEPTIKHLISLCDRPGSGIHIDEIWSMDAANSGDSALLNEKSLGSVFDWIDHARDILNFVENFVPEGPFVASTNPLPVHLNRVSPDCSSRRQKSGFHDRNVHGLGHSFGGCCVASAACANPKLFQSLTLVEAMILPEGNNYIQSFVINALLRRQYWSSREEAKASFIQSPFFKRWDPEAVDMFVQYALVDVPKSGGGGVRLKMTAFQEAVCYTDNQFCRETYQLLEGLDENVKIKWILAKVPAFEDHREYIQAMVWRRPNNSSNVCINSGHLAVQEAPLELAREIVHSWKVLYAEKADPIWARL